MYVVSEVRKQFYRKISYRCKDPIAKQDDNQKNSDQFRNKCEGLFLDRGNRLQDADNQTDNQGGKQHWRRCLKNQINGLFGNINNN